MFELINEVLHVDFAASLREAAEQHQREQGARYRARILSGFLGLVGVMDLLEGRWVRADDGEVFTTSDVSEAEWLANSLNDGMASQYRSQVSVMS